MTSASSVHTTTATGETVIMADPVGLQQGAPLGQRLDDLSVDATTLGDALLAHAEASSISVAVQEAKELLSTEPAGSLCHHLLRALEVACQTAQSQAAPHATSSLPLNLVSAAPIAASSQASRAVAQAQAASTGADSDGALRVPACMPRDGTWMQRSKRQLLRKRASACVHGMQAAERGASSSLAMTHLAKRMKCTATCSMDEGSSTVCNTAAPWPVQDISSEHSGVAADARRDLYKQVQQLNKANSSAVAGAALRTQGKKAPLAPPGDISECIRIKAAIVAPLTQRLRMALCNGPQAQDLTLARSRLMPANDESMAESDKQLCWPGAILNALSGKAASMQQNAKARVHRLSERQEGVRAWHQEAEAEAQRRREEAMRQRLAALKSSDMGAYLAMVRNTKNSRLEELLKQTDTCLKTLAAKLHKAAARANTSKGSRVADDKDNGSTADAEGHVSVDGVLDSSLEWGRLAQRLQADIAEQPEMLQGELREYQMQGLRWMVALHDNGLNGILADDMGLGKTVQVISLLAYFVEVRGQQGPFLIAAPASVVANWAAELACWAPSLKVVDYRGSADVREALYNKQVSRGRFNVLLTSYEFLMGKADRPRLSRHKWSWIVVDEGHRLKNSECKLNEELKHYSATSRLLLTGTPLQNKLDELWSLLNFLMPTIFGSADDFDAWFGAPLAALQASKGSKEDDGSGSVSEAAMLSQEEYLLVTNRLHSVLRPFMLRRLKESVASELPGKTEVVLTCPMSSYQQVLTGLVKRRLEGGQDAGAASINNTVMELRTICNHPLISRLHPAFCEDLLPPNPLPAVLRLSGKVELLDRMLLRLSARGHRCLLFCTMTRALDVLEEYLEWRGWEFLRMDGNTGAAERGELVKRFNDPKSSALLFLLSIRAGGVGLNLQAADTVIMYDTDWNPQIDLQAQARAHRIGQKNHVLVLRLQTEDSIEGHVAAVAAQKRRFADSSITGGFFDGKTSAEERRSYLLNVLQNQGSNAGSTDRGSSNATRLSDAALDKLLARSSEELELLSADTAKRAAAQQGPAGTTAGTNAAPAAVESVADASASVEPMVVDATGPGEEAPLRSPTATEHPPEGRLASAAECAQLISAAMQAAAPKRKAEPELLGRGVRRAASGPQLSDTAQQRQPKRAHREPPATGAQQAASKQAPPISKGGTASSSSRVVRLQQHEEGDGQQQHCQQAGLVEAAMDAAAAAESGKAACSLQADKSAEKSSMDASTRALAPPPQATEQAAAVPKKRGRPPKAKGPASLSQT